MPVYVRNKRINEQLCYKTTLHEYISDRMHHIDRFLMLVDQYKDIPLSLYIQKFKESLEHFITLSQFPSFIKSLKLKLEVNSILSNNTDLVLIVEKAMLTFMNFNSYNHSLSELTEIELKFADYYRGNFLVEYYMAQTLCNLLSRHRALEIIKEYTRGYYLSPEFQPKKVQSLEEYAHNSIDRNFETHQAIYAYEHGRLFFKVERCLYAEKIRDLPDKELIYYLECYGDYFNHVQKNENFVLTRTQTIMKGDPCCDFCFHDKREIEEIYHPSKTEWKEMEQKVNNQDSSSIDR